MINEVDLLGEEEVSGDIFKDMSLPPILLDNEFLNQRESLGEQVQIKSLKDISQDLSSKLWKKNISPSWKIIKSKHCTIEVRSFGNYSVNFNVLSGLDAFQYIMREALKQDGESEFSVINTESQIQCIKNVMAYGVGINKPYVQLTEVEVDRDDVTPLSQAANSNNIALLNFLLSKGGKVTPSVLRAIPSEISEFSNKSAQTVSFLIGQGVDINMSDDLGGIMHKTYFSNCYNDSFMAFLLENGLDHKVINKEGRSLLHIAVQKRNHAQSIMLMEKGADLYLADSQSITPFDLAEDKYFKSRLEINYKKYQEQRIQIEQAKNIHLADIEQRFQNVQNENIAIDARRNIDTNYVMSGLPEGDYGFAETSKKDKTEKPKQEIAQLNQNTLDYLTYFLDKLEKKAQKAEEVQIYDVSRSTAQSSMFSTAYSELFGIPTAYGNQVLDSTKAVAVSLTASTSLYYGLAEGALALGRTVLPIARGIPQATVVVGGLIGLHNAAQFEHDHPWISDDFTEIMLNPLVPQETKDEMWKQMQNDPLLVGQQQPLRTANVAVIDFKVMGRIDNQGHGSLISPYFDIDPNASKLTILSTPIPYQPKSILFTPDDSNSSVFTKFGQVEGFAPNMHKIWQEYFPDQSALIDDFNMSVLYKDYPNTVEKINNRHPINGDLAGKQFPLSEDLHEIYPNGVWFKENGCPDFTPYADITVEVEGLTGARWKDEQKANKAVGIFETPEDMTWHHVEDGKTMQLVPENLHYQVKHTGGAARIKENNKR